MIGEVNSETDFVARDDNFLGFVNSVMDRAVEMQSDDVAAVAGGDIEDARQALAKNRREHLGSTYCSARGGQRCRRWLCPRQQPNRSLGSA